MWAIGDYNVLTIFAMLFALIGSYSVGYLFLRVGWPKIRTLGEEYRAGWSIAVGVVFSLFVITATWASRALGFSYGVSSEQFFLTWTLGFFLALGMLEIKRKLYWGKMPEEEIPEQAKAETAKEEKKETEAEEEKEASLESTETPKSEEAEEPIPYK
ncbi:MAG: hypothetical protein V1847_03170 [Candidatus Diapherotrites archaeon]